MVHAEELLGILARSYRLIGSPGRVLLALSGGADSVALFHLLRRLAEEERFYLHAAHVHHGLREAADADEGFVTGLCSTWGVPLSSRRVEVPRIGSLEAAAREARYQALTEAMVEHSCQVIALGHHADDQAETLLMHLLYGAGPGGLAGMRPYNGTLWRPLLQVEGDDLRQFLVDNEYAWREDVSNRDERYTRNAIRGRLMPLLKDLSPTVTGHLGKTTEIIQVEEDYWADFSSAWLASYARQDPPAPFLMIGPCLALHEAARRRVLRAFCEQSGILLDHAQTLRLSELLAAAPGSLDNLPRGVRALRTQERLFLLLSGEQPQPALGILREGSPEHIGVPCERFDAENMRGAELRTRRPGDRIAPLGAGGSKPLGEYMTDRKIDRPLRDAWPLLCRGQQVLWVIGVGLAQTAAVSDETREITQLWYEGRLPGSIN